MSDTSGKERVIHLRAYNGTNVTASRLVKTGDGVLGKVVVNSHTSGTFKLFDSTAYGTNAIGGTYTPAAGSSVISLEPLGFDTGLYIGVAGTIDLTVYYF